MKNQTVPKKNGGSRFFFLPTNFVSRIVLRSCETAVFVADASPNRKQFPRDKSAAQWNWILAIILHAGFHERDLASGKNFNGKELPL